VHLTLPASKPGSLSWLYSTQALAEPITEPDLYVPPLVRRAQMMRAILRIPLSAEISADADELLRSGKSDVFGADSGVGYPAADGLPGATIVPGTFNVVRVAVALPKGRSSEAQAKIAAPIGATATLLHESRCRMVLAERT
jgi:hypothetical protein